MHQERGSCLEDTQNIETMELPETCAGVGSVDESFARRRLPREGAGTSYYAVRPEDAYRHGVPQRKGLKSLLSYLSKKKRIVKKEEAGSDEEPQETPEEKEPLLGYVPISVFASLSVITLGLYPYIWFSQNIRAFMELSLERIEEATLRRYVVLGYFVHVLLYIAIALSAVGSFFDAPLAREYAHRFALVYAFISFVLLLPVRSFLYFGLRWNLRRAVAAWDSNIITVPRTAPYLWKLFVFGALYIQFHINRVIGLGMPGFADADDLREAQPFLEWVNGYLRGINEPISRGRRR